MAKLVHRKLLDMAIAHSLAGSNCPRGTVSAVVADNSGFIMGIGTNGLSSRIAPCDCNCGTDSMKTGSKTCLAVHAEVRAVMEALSNKMYVAETIATTRPPCHECLKVLLDSNINVIVTTDIFEDRDGSRKIWERYGGKWVVLTAAD